MAAAVMMRMRDGRCGNLNLNLASPFDSTQVADLLAGHMAASSAPARLGGRSGGRPARALPPYSGHIDATLDESGASTSAPWPSRTDVARRVGFGWRHHAADFVRPRGARGSRVGLARSSSATLRPTGGFCDVGCKRRRSRTSPGAKSGDGGKRRT